MADEGQFRKVRYDEILRLCNAQKLTINALANAAFVDPKSIGRWKRRPARLLNIIAVAEVLDVPYAQLLDGYEPPKDDAPIGKRRVTFLVDEAAADRLILALEAVFGAGTR
jgi:hypothetical protein